MNYLYAPMTHTHKKFNISLRPDLRASDPSTVPMSVTRTITRRSTRTITPSTMTIMKSKKRRDEIIVIQRFVPNSSAVGHSNNRYVYEDICPMFVIGIYIIVLYIVYHILYYIAFRF